MKYQRKTTGVAIILLSILIPQKHLLAQMMELPSNGNGQYGSEKVPFISDFTGSKPAVLYKTIDGLIIDDYKKTAQADGSVNVIMKIYNPLIIGGKFTVYNADGTVDFEKSKDIEAIPSVGKNLIDQGGKVAQEYANVFLGKDGNFMDILKYPIGDPRTNVSSQPITITLKPGQTIELTNRDEKRLLEQKIEAAYSLASAMTKKLGGKNLPDANDIKTKSFLNEFRKDLSSEFIQELLKGSFVTVTTEGITLVEAIKDGKVNINYKLLNKFLSELQKSAEKKIQAEGLIKKGGELVIDTTSSLLSQGVGEVLKKIGGGGVAIAADFVYDAVSFIDPINKLYIIDKLGKLPKSPPGLLIANSGGEIFYPINVTPIMAVRPNITDGISAFNSCVTQYNTSHIGSAGCHFTAFTAADIPVQNEINKQRPDSIQAANTYTNGTIVKAPLDIGLTWNQSTNLDLDSHTITPNGEHVYFSERGSLNNAPNTFLYRDSIPAAGSLGAEQTRITSFQEGEYRFYVYNYSDQQNLAPAGLSNSAAKVEIFQGGAPLTDIPNDPNNFDLNNPALQKVGQPYPGQNTFNVPTGQSGNTWYVFKLDTRTGILTKVNRFGNVDGSVNVPKFR